jgi:hypothetical protein
MYQAKTMAKMPQAALVSQRCFDIMRRYPLQTSEVAASVIVIVRRGLPAGFVIEVARDPCDGHSPSA